MTSTNTNDIVVLSNTQPYEHIYDGNSITANSLVSGLTASLDQVLKRTDGTWIAWGDGEADYEVTDDRGAVRVPPEDEAYTLRRLKLSPEEENKHYEGFCNRVLWPLCHDLLDNLYMKEGYWGYYKQVNERFAEAAAEEVSEGGLVWTQDYHFALVPEMVRARRDDVTLRHFWHIPWPSANTFRVCPFPVEVLEGLLGNDKIGFHIEEYRDNFLDCVRRFCDDATVEDDGTISYDGRTVQTSARPLGVDVHETRTCANTVSGHEWESFREQYDISTETVLLGVERIDYMKGIPRRIDALEHFFEENPDMHGNVTYVQKSSVSRGAIPEYKATNDSVENRIEEVNERFGNDAWTPIVHIKERLPERYLCALYRYSDVLLVTSLIDGMNLVSQEYVAAKRERNGALVLSEFAGSSELLDEGAYIVNPYDTPAVADTIDEALRADDEEKKRRMESMRKAVNSNDINQWLEGVNL